jgi:hypothetical protein
MNGPEGASVHQSPGLFQTTANFHPNVVIAQLSFLGNFGITEPKHEVLTVNWRFHGVLR